MGAVLCGLASAPHRISLRLAARLLRWVRTACLRTNSRENATAAYAARGRELSFPWAYAHGYLLPPLRGST